MSATHSIRFTVYLAPSDYSSLLADFADAPKPIGGDEMMRIVSEHADNGVPMDITVDSPHFDILEQPDTPAEDSAAPEDGWGARWNIVVSMSADDYAVQIDRMERAGLAPTEYLPLALAYWSTIDSPGSLEIEVKHASG